MGVRCAECGAKFSPGLHDAPCAYCEAERLAREVKYLRHYGNSACTHMADQAMIAGDLDDDKEQSDG